MNRLATICFGNKLSHTFIAYAKEDECLHVARALWVTGNDYVCILTESTESWYYWQWEDGLQRPTYSKDRTFGRLTQEPCYT